VRTLPAPILSWAGLLPRESELDSLSPEWRRLYLEGRVSGRDITTHTRGLVTPVNLLTIGVVTLGRTLMWALFVTMAFVLGGSL
jgi:hypothetical protein